MRRIPLIATCVLVLAACGGAGPTADAHDLTLPQGTESVFPLPEDASVMFNESEDDATIVVFSPGMPYGDAAEFFSDAFDSGDWTMTNESIGDGDGEVHAEWQVEGNGVAATVSLTGFGGQSATNVNGHAMVESQP